MFCLTKMELYVKIEETFQILQEKLHREGECISITVNETTDGSIPCGTFSGVLYDCLMKSFRSEDCYQVTDMPNGVYFHVYFPCTSASTKSHTFGVYFDDSQAYIIQTFENFTTPIVKRFKKKEFEDYWNQLTSDSGQDIAASVLFSIPESFYDGETFGPMFIC